MIKPTCATCISALDCEQYGDPWRNNQPCEAMEEYINQDEIVYEEETYLLLENIDVLGKQNGLRLIISPPIEETIAHMGIVESIPGKEIAANLKLQPSYVYRVIAKYRKRLKKHLKEVIDKQKKAP